MFIPALILVLSVAAGIHFAALSWHAGVLRTASQSVEAAAAMGVGADFDQAVAYRQICPDLGSGAKTPLGTVRAYHLLLEALSAVQRVISRSSAGAESGWMSRELDLCARYARVALAQRIQQNRAMIAEVGSF